tara:strand:+ start:458 stop:679 length:222 start_codon:yes stop_codon:yes gene_type:complete
MTALTKEQEDYILKEDIDFDNGYTEYGYRGLEELRKWTELATQYKLRITELEEEIKNLKEQIDKKDYPKAVNI